MAPLPPPRGEEGRKEGRQSDWEQRRDLHNLRLLVYCFVDISFTLFSPFLPSIDAKCRLVCG
jgi:hypothetical protein